MVMQPQNCPLTLIELRQRLLKQHFLVGSHARRGDRNVCPRFAEIDRFTIP